MMVLLFMMCSTEHFKEYAHNSLLSESLAWFKYKLEKKLLAIAFDEKVTVNHKMKITRR